MIEIRTKNINETFYFFNFHFARGKMGREGLPFLMFFTKINKSLCIIGLMKVDRTRVSPNINIAIKDIKCISVTSCKNKTFPLLFRNN